LLALATYLSHFLAFGILGLGSLLICIRAYGRAWRRYLAWLSALAPSLAGLTWYTSQRAGEFWFHYAFHNPLYYTWYQVGPWAVASSYYPLTPYSLENTSWMGWQENLAKSRLTY
jgi:hypothetical protein